MTVCDNWIQFSVTVLGFIIVCCGEVGLLELVWFVRKVGKGRKVGTFDSHLYSIFVFDFCLPCKM